MRIPRYWAESRRQRRQAGRQVTVRRFGWSDEGVEGAQRHADQRAEVALDQAWQGRDVLRREPKVAYNGAEGVPIREEIVAEHGSTIITRNSYGALCLNTPDVLFADIDFPTGTLGCRAVALIALAAAAVLIGAAAADGTTTVVAAVLLTPFVVGVTLWLASLLVRLTRRVRGGQPAIALRRIQAYAESRRDWQLRVYRTPAGLRVLAMHQLFDPTDEATHQLFASLGVDPVYALMCRRQACFRARVTPKPWRIGWGEYIKPRRGVWPIAEERLPARRAWVAEYEQAARNHAACEYVTSFGTGRTHEKARAVQKLHDELCRATSGLPTA
ncbi:hypothetical protein Pla123a_36570 [Posidoniimonas polymericola]|uniref:Transmembrane protein n=1 Tax=Posidoniimonas polymericola TaxID=2528002 RepID=A0A5C5YFZ1_9BACT|nr:hypothetical protein [Posidoniimonas polymericola]TWT73763.1 hypothetical protein Pla123a_36570 [Posidoniimonas polymericola]